MLKRVNHPLSIMFRHFHSINPNMAARLSHYY